MVNFRPAATTLAQKNVWPSRKRSGKGGGKEYFYAGLPDDMKTQILARFQKAQGIGERLKTGTAVVVAGAAKPPVKVRSTANALGGLTRKPKAAAAMNDKDRAYQDAALILCSAIDESAMSSNWSEAQAILDLAERIVSGAADAGLIQAADTTYLKKRKTGQTVSALVSRLQKAMACYRAGLIEGEITRYLVAGRPAKTGFKHEDKVAFLIHYCRPSRPSVAKAWKDAKDWYAANHFVQPAYDTFIRIEKSLPMTVKCRGRMTGAAYRSLLPYVARDVSMFQANDIWVCDGHTFKARVRSPIYGQPFRPEITFVIDWVSRKIVGWSVDLSESTIAVSAAYRHAQISTRAKPLLMYSDGGSGQCNKVHDHPITGVMVRQGVEHQTGIPGNPQGRGVIERIWASTVIELASNYATSLTRQTDRDHIRKIGVAIGKAARAGQVPEWVPPWETFLEDLPKTVDDYNNRPHSSLDGKTPNQVYQEKFDPDSLLSGATDEDINALWMPQVVRTPSRGLVQLFTNSYFRAELVDELAEGEKVRVGYDIHDAEAVTIYRMDGTPIGAAQWDGNKHAAFPVPHIEEKRLDRAKGKKALAERDIALADAELMQTLTVSTADFRIRVPAAEPEAVGQREDAPAARVAAPAPEAKPNLLQLEDPALIRWLAAHPEDWNNNLRNYLAEQADKIKSVARLVDEFDLWAELETRAGAAGFEERAAVSGN